MRGFMVLTDWRFDAYYGMGLVGLFTRLTGLRSAGLGRLTTNELH